MYTYPCKLVVCFIFVILNLIVLSTQVSNFIQFRNCIKENSYIPNLIVDPNTNATYYHQLNLQWNLRKQHVFPLAYFLPTRTQDIQLVILCGNKSNIPLIPKSGGHSYESFSAGNSDSVVIDFRKMNNININQNEETATIQPGALLGPVNAKIWSLGFGLPMGQCHTVGMGGHALGGGIGYFSHLYGLLIDNIIEIIMVDAYGFIHKVNAIENPDLFWALRGVGSGYIGIVTSFKFKLFNASEIKITFVKLTYILKEALDLLDAYQNWIIWTKKNEPAVMSLMQMKGFITNKINVGDGIEIHTMHIQDKDIQPSSNKKFLEMVHKIFPSNGNITVSYPSYMDVVINTGYAPIVTTKSFNEYDLTTLPLQITQPRYFKVKSFYVNKWFDKNSQKITAELIKRMPRKNIYVVWTSEPNNNQIASNTTSYVHSDNLYTISIQYEGSNTTAEVQSGMTYIQEFMDGIKFMDNGETYQNFVDSDLKNEYLNRYYGKNLQRLLYIKSIWDPENYFHNQQSLPIV